MRRAPVRAGLSALLLVALLFCLGDAENAAALLLPILTHELGHLLALWALGLPIRGFQIELRGLCIEYGGHTGALGHAFVALSGPLAGLAYAFALSRLGVRIGSDWAFLSAGISLCLTLFNLLPALPLDGGVLLLRLSSALCGARVGRKLTEIAGLLVGAGLLGWGFSVLLHGGALAPVLAAIWLLLSQESGQGLVKRADLV